LVIWLPQLCRKSDIPFCFVKGKARLGGLVHKKTATAVALTHFRPEDKGQFELMTKSYKNQFNDNANLRKVWGGGILGSKSQHKID